MSYTLTNLVCAPNIRLDAFFFSAFSFYPGRRANDESTTFLPNSFHLTDTDSNDGDTEIECADDWLEEPELEEVATKISSKAAEAMAIEVSAPRIPLFFLSLQILYSGQLGMTRPPYLTQ